MLGPRPMPTGLGPVFQEGLASNTRRLEQLIYSIRLFAYLIISPPRTVTKNPEQILIAFAFPQKRRI